METLKEIVSGLLKEEKEFIRRLTLGEKLTQENVEDLFSMLYEYELTKSASVSSMFFALWSQLLNGLRSETDKNMARQAFKYAKKCAFVKIKQENLIDKSSAFDDDPRIEGMLKDLEDLFENLQEEIRNLSRRIASKYIPESQRTDDTNHDVDKVAEPTVNYRASR